MPVTTNANLAYANSPTPNQGTINSTNSVTAINLQYAGSTNPIMNSITFAQNQQLPLQTSPIAGQTVNDLAGMNIPILGSQTVGSLASGIIGSFSPVASQIISGANYLANLPLSLYRRPGGLILIGNQTANVLFSLFYTRKEQIIFDGVVDPYRMNQHGLSYVLSHHHNDSPLYVLGEDNWYVKERVFVDKLAVDLGPKSILNSSVKLQKDWYYSDKNPLPIEYTKETPYEEGFKSDPDYAKSTPVNFIPYEVNPNHGVSPAGGMLPGNHTAYKDLAMGIDGLSTYATLTYEQISKRANDSKNGKGATDFRTELPNQVTPSDGANNSKKVLERFAWPGIGTTKGVDPMAKPVSNGPINLMGPNNIVDPVMKNSSVTDTRNLVKDFITFNFKDKRNGNIFQFRSYLTSLSDKWASNFQDVKYVGRPNPLKMFDSVTRDVSLEFLVPALSSAELSVMYSKLEGLAQLTMPTNTGIMVAPFMEFNIGSWFENEIGHITTLDYSIDIDYPWEINLQGDFLEMPHIIKVSMGIFIIGRTSMETNAYSIFGTTRSK